MRGNSRAVTPSVCGYRLFIVRLSALIGTPIAPGSLRQKRQAREACLYLFCLLLFEEYETATARETRDRQTCRRGRGADGQIPERRRSRVRQEERVTSRLRLSKGKPAIWGPGSPPLPSPQNPPPPQPRRAPGRPFCPLSPVLVASCAAAQPSLGQTASSLLGDGVPQPVTSPRLRGRGGARRRRPRRLLMLPGNRLVAAGQRRPTVRALKGTGTFYKLQPRLRGSSAEGRSLGVGEV